MEPSGLSTAIMLAAAAVLWFLYFVPAWIRKREYVDTERTAARLQRTLRVMAESAQAPEAVRVEATAREAARQERMRLAAERQAARLALRDAQAAAEARAEIARVRSAQERLAAGPARPTVDVRARLRRTRRAAGLTLLAALVVAGVQGWLVATTGVSVGAWAVLAACAAAAVLSVAVQGRIRSRLESLAPVAAPARARRRADPVDLPLEPARPVRDWTPVPLPKPIYVEHPDAAPLRPALAAPTMDAAALLRAAEAEAARADREDVAQLPAPAERQAPVERQPVERQAPAERPSRFARMGFVDAEDASAPDLDEVLRRRRNVG